MPETGKKQYTKPTLTRLQPTPELEKLFEDQLRLAGYERGRLPRQARG